MKLPLVCIISVLSAALLSSEAKPIVLDNNYEHDRWLTMPQDHIKQFRSFTVSFDTDDDNDGLEGQNDIQQADRWRIPEWVAYEIKKFDGDKIPTHKRPDWFADPDLVASGDAPVDDSYKTTRPFRSANPDWFVRGHLCMKMIAARLGKNTEWNTHTFLNAIPQRSGFNGGIWLDLEYLTGAWAQKYDRVWVITGPIIMNGHPAGFIGDEGEPKVAIPDALFKIVIKEQDNGFLDTLAFIYPQVGPGYTAKKDELRKQHKRFLTSIDEIEKMTGLDFLTDLNDAKEKAIEKAVAEDIWAAEPEHFLKSDKQD